MTFKNMLGFPLFLISFFLMASQPVYADKNMSWAQFPWQSELERNHPLNGKVWSLKDKKFISPKSLIQKLASQNYIGLGETHDNPDHHLLQAWIVQQVVRQGKRKPDIVFEMIDEGQKLALQKFLQSRRPDARNLGKALEWQNSGWPDWSLYQPIAQIALNAGLNLRAGNPTRQQGKKIAKKGFGSLGEKRQNLLHLEKPLPQILANDLGKQIVSSHCNMIPASATSPMVRVQRLRDAVMANNLLKSSPKDGAILIAGSGHVRQDRGVPWYIRQSGHKMVSVVMAEAERGVDDPLQLISQAPQGYLIADYIWITPRTERPDPCEQFKKMMKRKHKR